MRLDRACAGACLLAPLCILSTGRELTIQCSAHRTFLQNTQAAIRKGKLRLQDVLSVKSDQGNMFDQEQRRADGGSDGGKGKGDWKGDSVADAMQHLLSNSGQLTQSMDAAMTDMRSRLAAHQDSSQSDGSAGSATRNRARSMHSAQGWLDALVQKVEAGRFVDKGGAAGDAFGFSS